MKRRVFKTGITTLLAVSLLLSAGCSKEKTTTEKGETQNKQVETPKEPAKLKVFANFPKAQPGAIDKAFLVEAEKGANVKLEFEIPPSTSYKERIQIMLASGTYADLIMFQDPSDEAFRNAVDSGILTPLDKYLKNASNINKYTYDASWKPLKLGKNNEIFAIPRTTVLRSEGYMVRKDWLDALNISYQKDFAVTLDEFTNILRKFTKEDPDKNGKKDTYGYAGSQDANKAFQYITKDVFNVVGWQETTGKYKYMDLQYSKEHDNFKKVLEYTATLYKEGLIDPDGPVNTQKTAIERFKKGITGVIKDAPTNVASYEKDMKAINPNAELEYMFIKNDKGNVQGTVVGSGAMSTGVWGCWGIPTTCKEPDAAVRFIDWMLSDKAWDLTVNGIEGLSYKVENGKKTYDVETVTKEKAWVGSLVRRKEDVNIFLNPANSENVNKKMKEWLGVATKGVIIPLDNGFVPAAASTPQLLDYKKVYDQGVTKILIGVAPVSSYDKLLDDWYKNGGEDYVNQMNDYIKKTLGK